MLARLSMATLLAGASLCTALLLAGGAQGAPRPTEAATAAQCSRPQQLAYVAASVPGGMVWLAVPGISASGGALLIAGSHPSGDCGGKRSVIVTVPFGDGRPTKIAYGTSPSWADNAAASVQAYRYGRQSRGR